MKVYINGKFYEEDEAKISVFDHGLLYGDGIFEGIRIYSGRIFALDEHIDRLYESAKTIILNILMDKAKMKKAVVDTVRANKLQDGYIRLVVTRGVGSLGLNPYLCNEAQVIIIADTIQLYPQELYENGLDIVSVPTMRNKSEALNPRVKSLNYLNNVMAKIEAINSGVKEAVMFNCDGYVAECTGDNIFIVKDGVLKTPHPSMGILEGVTRNCVIDLCRNGGCEVDETTMTRHDLYNADECFLTGTAAEIIPVIKIDGRIIGEGRPGEFTKRLINSYKELTAHEGTPVY